MNYLAHAYLSFDHPQVLVGNLISDYVKGKKKFDYSPLVLAGIHLHRSIDDFTDSHPITNQAKSFFRPAYGLYSGAFIDIVYDHFLSTDESIFTDSTLKSFSNSTYNVLEQHTAIFPPTFRQLFPYMKEHDWLYNYRHTWGMEKSFQGLVYRAKYMNSSIEAIRLFELHYDELKDLYREFFPALLQHGRNEFYRLIDIDT